MIKSNTDHADVLFISVNDANSIANRPHLVHQLSSGSAVSHMPSDVGTKGFVGIRFVHYFDTNNIVVELKSLAPPFSTYYTRWNNTQYAWTHWYRIVPTDVSTI